MVLPEILASPSHFVELYFGTGIGIYLFVAYVGFSVWAGVIRAVFIFVPEPAENLLNAFSNITIIIGFVYIKWLHTFSEGYASGPRTLSKLAVGIERLHADIFSYVIGNDVSETLINRVDSRVVDRGDRYDVRLNTGLVSEFNKNRDIKNLLNNLTRLFRSAIRHLFAFYLSKQELAENGLEVDNPEDYDPIDDPEYHIFLSETARKKDGRSQPTHLEVLDGLVSAIQAVLRQLETRDIFLSQHHQSLIGSLDALKSMIDDTKSQNRIRVPIFFEAHVEFIIIFYMSIWLPLQVDFNGGWYSLGATPILLLMFLGPAIIRNYIRNPFDPNRIENGMDYTAWQKGALKRMYERYIEYVKSQHTMFAHMMHVSKVNYEQIYDEGTSPMLEGIEIMDMHKFVSKHQDHDYLTQRDLRERSFGGLDPKTLSYNLDPFPLINDDEDEDDRRTLIKRNKGGAINRSTKAGDAIILNIGPAGE